jgi:F420-dependent oxidoreductase-like protein
MISPGNPPPVRFGAQLWSQATDWPGFRDAALAAEAAGWDSVWTWDHLLAIFGSPEQPTLEGWTALAGLGPITRGVRLGLMVGANTFRNPGLTAKLATTLDHVSGGRAVLGIGGAWFEREHDAFGIEFGAGVGERLDRLDEAVMLLRRLLDGERVTHEGRFYTFRDALCEPRPLQAHLPILVGGSGPKKTLRTIARRGDGWNTNGTLDDVRDRLAVLDAHCADVGRDRSEIELTVSFPIVLRDDRAAAEAAWAGLMAHNGTPNAGNVPHLLGSPVDVAGAIRPYVELGFRTIIVRLPAPYDGETIDRIGEVAALLADA